MPVITEQDAEQLDKQKHDELVESTGINDVLSQLRRVGSWTSQEAEQPFQDRSQLNQLATQLHSIKDVAATPNRLSDTGVSPTSAVPEPAPTQVPSGSPSVSNEQNDPLAGLKDVLGNIGGTVKNAVAPEQPQQQVPQQAGQGLPGEADVEKYIRQSAQAFGVNPDDAILTWSHEGRSNYTGDKGSSFGPFQLHYGNVAPGGNAVGGLGDEFTKQTGLDARDPN